MSDTEAATGRCKATTRKSRAGEVMSGLSVTVDFLLSAHHLKRKRATVQSQDSAELASTA